MRAGFSGGMLYSTPCSFPRSMMLPESISSQLEQGVYIVEPLFYGRSELGHLVFSMEGNGSYIAENLRSSFSAAVRGIELFEEATRMRKEAERSGISLCKLPSNLSSAEPTFLLTTAGGQVRNVKITGTDGASLLGELLED